jgi:hypothetical protein
LLLSAVLAATIEVPAGTPLSEAMGRARPGDVVRLGPGLHAGSLGRLSAVRVEGAGVGRTRVVAPEGQDGAVVTGRVELAGLSIEAGAARSALKVLGGEAILEGVSLSGGAIGAFIDDGSITGRDVALAGGYALLQKSGEVKLRDGVAGASGEARAGISLLRGRLELARFAITGPFAEAALTVSGGTAVVDELVIRAPGPTGIAVTRGELAGRDVEVAGARELPVKGSQGVDAILGDCAQVRRGTLRLASSALASCGGTALSASGGEIRLDGVELQGGSAGGIVLLDGARADLRGNWITGRGPALVVATGSQVDATFNRWRADPVFWVECSSGSRLRLGFGEHHAAPCSAPR